MIVYCTESKYGIQVTQAHHQNNPSTHATLRTDVPKPPFWVYHALVPLAIALPLSIWLMGAGGDLHIASAVYSAEGGHWALRHAWITAKLIHHGGKNLSIAGGLFVAIVALGTRRHRKWAYISTPASYLFCAVLLSTLIVSLLKHISHMDCPWDLLMYGGSRPYISLFQSRAGLPASGCFPAGHASAGYAWVASYFACIMIQPRCRWYAFIASCVLGGTFGISQELRGAHFVSHDLWCFMVCWYTALGLYYVWQKFLIAVPCTLKNTS